MWVVGSQILKRYGSNRVKFDYLRPRRIVLPYHNSYRRRILDDVYCRLDKKFFGSFCLKNVKTNRNIFHAPLLPPLPAFLFCIAPGSDDASCHFVETSPMSSSLETPFGRSKKYFSHVLSAVPRGVCNGDYAYKTVTNTIRIRHENRVRIAYIRRTYIVRNSLFPNAACLYTPLKS